MERNREEEIANAQLARSTTTRTGSSGSRESKMKTNRESKSNYLKGSKKSNEMKEETNTLKINKQKTSGDLSGKSRLVKVQSADAGMDGAKTYLLGQDFIPSI